MAATAVVRVGLLCLALTPFVYYLFAIVAAIRFYKNGPVPSGNFPPISVLKPIRGLDRETYDNFSSFCLQDYPSFEIVFCVADESEPAIPVIEQLIRDFPHRSIRLLVGSSPLGISDKVNKMCRMVREARYELVIVSDSDVRVEPEFLRAIAAPFADPEVGGVSCLYKGLTNGSLAADLEALGNSTDFASGVLVASKSGNVNFMLGAAMVTTKKHLSEIGGFEAMADYLSDDYELGNRIAARGYRVEISKFPVSIVYPEETIADAFRHQLRWNVTIRCSRPLGHFGLLFSQGLFWTILAAAIAPNKTVAAFYIAAYLILRIAVAWIVAIRGMRDDLVRRKLWLLPVRDAFAFIVWVCSFFPQPIYWRGQEFHVRDKRLVPSSRQL